MMNNLKFTDYGDIIITEEKDPDEIINQIMEKYNEPPRQPWR
jgi:tRNA uridine 5-carbamoylmethylation protein Kti12